MADKEEYHKASELGETLEGEQIAKEDIKDTPIVVTNVVMLPSSYKKKGKKVDSDEDNNYCIFQFFKHGDKKKTMLRCTGGEVLTKKFSLAKTENKLPALGKLVLTPTKDAKFEYWDFVDVDAE